MIFLSVAHSPVRPADVTVRPGCFAGSIGIASAGISYLRPGGQNGSSGLSLRLTRGDLGHRLSRKDRVGIVYSRSWLWPYVVIPALGRWTVLSIFDCPAKGDKMTIESRKSIGLAIMLPAVLMAVCAWCAFPAVGKDAAPPSIVTGVVSSDAEGPMEGVLVKAKRVGGTITITVVSDDHGRYAFPADRLKPGEYVLAVRARGYDVPKTTITVADKTTPPI